MDENNQAICQVCHQPVLPEYYFCPNCGHNLQEKEVSISAISQIGWYLFSLAMPPLGLWPAVKFIQKKGKQPKLVGVIMLILTIASTFIITKLIFSMFTKYINQINEMF